MTGAPAQVGESSDHAAIDICALQSSVWWQTQACLVMEKIGPWGSIIGRSPALLPLGG
jgi:hypothetical protein